MQSPAPFDSKSALYRIEPSTVEDVRWAARLAVRVYYGHDVIPQSTMAGWFHANPHGFSTFWHGPERAGNFTLLPLRPQVMQHFLEGRLLERDIKQRNLFSPDEARDIRGLHWESIVIDPDFTGSRARMMKTFALGFPDLIARLCPPAQVSTLSAIAASRQGAGVLRRMGLVPTGDAASRLDGHPLYTGTVASHRAASDRLFRRGGTKVCEGSA